MSFNNHDKDDPNGKKYGSKPTESPRSFIDFTITTSPQTAEKIKKQCEWDERVESNRSYRLGKITTKKGVMSDYSLVQIIAKNGQIDHVDVFFLGFFAAGK